MSHNIHVGHISTMSGWGGVERLLLDFLIGSRAPSRFHHHLLASSINSEILAALQDANILYFQPKRRFRYDPTAIIQMAKWVRQQKIPIIHTYNARANAWGAIIALLAGSKVHIAGEHGTIWSMTPMLSLINRWAYKRAHFIVANSHASKTMIQHKFGIAEEKIKVIYNFVPPLPKANRDEVRKMLGVSSKDIVVGSIGRASPEKNFALLIDTAHAVVKCRQNVRFILVGGGDQLAYLKQYAHEIGLSDKFIFTDYRADARNLLQGFDIFVNTSIWESFGNAPIEAALAEIPVIAPWIDGLPEAIGTQSSGILLTPTKQISQPRRNQLRQMPKVGLIRGQLVTPLELDRDELKKSILELVDDPLLRRQYGQTAKMRAEQLFTFSRYQNEAEKLYELAVKS